MSGWRHVAFLLGRSVRRGDPAPASPRCRTGLRIPGTVGKADRSSRTSGVVVSVVFVRRQLIQLRFRRIVYARTGASQRRCLQLPASTMTGRRAARVKRVHQGRQRCRHSHLLDILSRSGSAQRNLSDARSRRERQRRGRPRVFDGLATPSRRVLDQEEMTSTRPGRNRSAWWS